MLEFPDRRSPFRPEWTNQDCSLQVQFSRRMVTPNLVQGLLRENGRSIEVLDGIDTTQSETTRARPYEIARRGFDGSFEQHGEDEAHGQHDGDSPYGHGCV